MVLGLLTIAAIPTTIGIGEAVSNRNSEKEKAKDNETLRKFTLKCYCDSPSRKRGEVDGGDVVLRNGKVGYISFPSMPGFTHDRVIHGCASSIHGHFPLYFLYPYVEQ